MNRYNNHQARSINQSGFGIIGILLIIVALATMGGVGYYAWSQSTQPDDPATSTTEGAELAESSEPGSDEAAAEFDNAVQTDLNRIMAAINSYAADNNGRLPAEPEEISEFEQSYLTLLGEHPVSGLPYTIDEAKSDTHELISYDNGVCEDDSSIRPTESSRQVALSTVLPSGKLYCVDY